MRLSLNFMWLYGQPVTYHVVFQENLNMSCLMFSLTDETSCILTSGFQTTCNFMQWELVELTGLTEPNQVNKTFTTCVLFQVLYSTVYMLRDRGQNNLFLLVAYQGVPGWKENKKE